MNPRALIPLLILATSCGDHITITLPSPPTSSTTTLPPVTTTTWPPATTTTLKPPVTTTTLPSGPTTTSPGAGHIFQTSPTCPGYKNTKRYLIEFPPNKLSQNYYATKELYPNGFSKDDIIVMEFVAPSKKIGLEISVMPIGNDIYREISLSERPCDFLSAPDLQRTGMFNLVLSSGDPGQYYVQRVLTPGKRYYLNMNTLLNGDQQCPDTCNMLIKLSNSNP